MSERKTRPGLEPGRFASAPRKDDPPRSDWHWYITRQLFAVETRLLEALLSRETATILDFGCGSQPYREVVPPEVEYVGADLPGNKLASLIVAEDGSLPTGAGTFDAVLSTQVLEHVPEPGKYLSEAHRALRGGGQLLLSTVNLQIYHPDPVDYWRWTCAGLERAVTEAGFEISHFEGIMGLAATGLQLIQDAIIFRLGGHRRLHRAVCTVMQQLVAFADRLERQESRDLNAMCFALLATKR